MGGSPTRVITLLTDFGARDIYVGVLHGVIAGIAPAARVVDLTHEVSPQAVAEGAFLLDAAAPYFPDGTIHVAVVDPGVGSDRRLLCAVTERATYLAPDNGLLTRVLAREPARVVVSIEDPAWFLSVVSRTFHGRDKLAPVAAHLACGLDPLRLGPVVAPGDVVRLAVPAPRRVAPDRLMGEVVHIDRYGNAVTNISPDGLPVVRSARIAGQQVLGPPCRSYAERAVGELLLITGSTGLLEVAVNAGDARARLGIARGAPVEVHTERASAARRASDHAGLPAVASEVEGSDP